MHQLEASKLTRKNAEVKPFEAGGDGQLEHLARRADAALFALGSSTKKRPHNLTLGGGPRPVRMVCMTCLHVAAWQPWQGRIAHQFQQRICYA